MKFTLIFLPDDSPLYNATIKETHTLTLNRLNLHINGTKYGPINNLLKKFTVISLAVSRSVSHTGIFQLAQF
jgi:hypothetical protein